MKEYTTNKGIKKTKTNKVKRKQNKTRMKLQYILKETKQLYFHASMCIRLYVSSKMGFV